MNIDGIDWRKYPLMADWFENRPEVNKFSIEFARLVADVAAEARADVARLRKALEDIRDNTEDRDRATHEVAHKALAAKG